ncbi:MAG: DUF4249 domain-containing protein [Rudanella sp.]|nr:DUF4249 domain-containing protein [Rudanella sp.]
MTIRSTVTMLLLVLGLTACIEPVSLPIRQTERRLVVEGLITNEPPPYLIKLTYSGNLQSSLLIPEELAINGAVVFVSDDAGNRARLEQDPLNPAFYWMRDPALRGQAGRRYSLSVQLPNGKRYVSKPELMPTVAALEPLNVRYRRQRQDLGQPDVYDIRINTQDPPTPGNYYRWASYGYLRRWAGSDPLNPPRNTISPCNTCTCWVPYYGPLGEVLSDVLINGNRIANRLVWSAPVYAVGPQYVEVRQFSLTRDAFQYWQRFEQQSNRTGSLFDAQPASIEGNVRQAGDDTTRLALGYFGASAVSRQRVTIPGDTLNYARFLILFGPRFIPPGNCLSAYPQPQFEPPLGWPPRR